MQKKIIFLTIISFVWLASCTTPAATPTLSPTATEAPATHTPIPPTATPEPPTATATVEATATATATSVPPTATATPIPPTVTATAIPPTATAEATATAAPEPIDGGDTAKTHPGGVVLPNGWVQYTSETYGGTTIAVPPDWWCVDYDPADQGETVNAISAAANDEFGMIKVLLGLPSPDHLFYCLADLDQFILQQESGIKVSVGRQQGFTRAIDMLQEIDRTKKEVSELTLSGYDAASYEGYETQTERYERITVALLAPPRTFNVQSYSQSEARLVEVAAIEQAIVIKSGQ